MAKVDKKENIDQKVESSSKKSLKSSYSKKKKVKKNILNLSDFKNKKPENLTVCILDRPRHKEIIDELNNMKVNLKLLSDGDVSGALLVTDDKYDVDLFMGIGGGPEGCLLYTSPSPRDGLLSRMPSSA